MSSRLACPGYSGHDDHRGRQGAGAGSIPHKLYSNGDPALSAAGSVGDLLDRQVLRPVESQPTVGRVRNVVRQADGGIYMVVNYGGLFGFFTRPIAVPVTAMALLGEYVEVIDFTPHQLDNFQRFDAAGTTPLPPDSLIDVGLIGPAH